MFKFFSETNKEAKRFLKPDLGLKGWNDLSTNEKDKIWHHLKRYFFDIQKIERYDRRELYPYEIRGYANHMEYKQNAIVKSIAHLNENYKAKSFAENYLKNPNSYAAFCDFYHIFMNQEEFVVMELLSAYAKFLLSQNDKFFDDFSERLNDVFLQFGIKYHLTKDGFIPRQEEKIIEGIYEPVLSCLRDPKWKEVSKILSDAFDEYIKNTPQGYSNCVTNTVSAIQAFLQIIVNGKTGKGEISRLIPEAQKRKLIPDDFFTKKIFENLESIFARERAETGIAHPKTEYANEKNARTMLNLAMIFFQHCIQK
jgi:hypothetical protein